MCAPPAVSLTTNHNEARLGGIRDLWPSTELLARVQLKWNVCASDKGRNVDSIAQRPALYLARPLKISHGSDGLLPNAAKRSGYGSSTRHNHATCGSSMFDRRRPVPSATGRRVRKEPAGAHGRVRLSLRLAVPPVTGDLRGQEREAIAAPLASLTGVTGCRANFWLSPDYAPFFWIGAASLYNVVRLHLDESMAIRPVAETDPVNGSTRHV